MAFPRDCDDPLHCARSQAMVGSVLGAERPYAARTRMLVAPRPGPPSAGALKADVRQRCPADGLGWDADGQLRMRNAEWQTLTLDEATLVGMTRGLRRFANV